MTKAIFDSGLKLLQPVPTKRTKTLKHSRYMDFIKKITVAAVMYVCCVWGVSAEPRPLKFAWGADLAASVDMSGHDMSAIGIDAMFGMQWQWVRFFGVGAQADVMVSNSSRTFPLTVNFRTDFSRRERLVFLDVRGGMALSYFDHDRNETNPYVSGGIGVTLAKSKTFSSHVIASYTWLGQKECYIGETLRSCPGISYVSIRLGVMF